MALSGNTREVDVSQLSKFGSKHSKITNSEFLSIELLSVLGMRFKYSDLLRVSPLRGQLKAFPPWDNIRGRNKAWKSHELVKFKITYCVTFSKRYDLEGKAPDIFCLDCFYCILLNDGLASCNGEI